MRRTHLVEKACAIAGGLLVLGLAGCGDSTSPAASPRLSAVETSDIGAATADEVDQSVGALTVEGAAAGVAFGRRSFSIAALTMPGASCATVDNTTDSDGDGAPDDATFTFALPACSFTGFRGGSLEITGTINLTDPTPNGADLNWLATLTDFQFHFTSPDASRSYTALRNGTRALSGTAAGASLSNNITVVRSFTGRSDATISHNLLLSFTPASGEVLAIGQPLPNGTFTKSGTLTWSRDGRTRTFIITTVEPLVWDASCTTDRKIVSGEIHATLANGSFIKTVWSGCGEDATRTFVPAGSDAA